MNLPGYSTICIRNLVSAIRQSIHNTRGNILVVFSLKINNLREGLFCLLCLQLKGINFMNGKWQELGSQQVTFQLPPGSTEGTG